MKWKVSLHACQRWAERIEDVSNTWQAHYRIQQEILKAFILPNRLASLRWVPKYQPGLTRVLRRQGVRYRITGKALFITQGHLVLTVFEITSEDLAILLVWTIFGQWVDEGPTELVRRKEQTR